MPPPVAPPPRTGAAAQGHLAEESTAATDRAAGPHDVVPAHPMPVAAARTAATGVLFAALAVAIAGILALLLLAVRAIAAGDAGVRIDGPPLVLLVVGVALTSAVALVLITRGWSSPRSATLAIAVAATVIWPLSGYAWLVAPLAIIVVGVLLGYDRRHPTRTPPRLDALLVLGLGGAIFLLAGAFTARAKPELRTPQPPVAALATADAEAGARDDDARADGDDAAQGDKDATDGDDAAKNDKDATDGDDAAKNDKDAADDDAATPGDDAAESGDDASVAGDDAAGDDAPAPAPREAPPAPVAAVPGDEAAPVVAPERFVRDYYADLDAQRFDQAWQALSPAVQASLGPYARWKAGYGDTISSRPQDFSVDGGSVTHILVARDRGCERARRFRVTWQLVPDGDGWTVTRLAAVAVGPQAC